MAFIFYINLMLKMNIFIYYIIKHGIMPQQPDKHKLNTVRLIEGVCKKLSDNEFILKALLVGVGIIYLILSIYPKHKDFYENTFISSAFALHGLNFIDIVVPKYFYTIEYTPTYFILQGIWLKIGSIFLHFDLNSFVFNRSDYLSPWIFGNPVPLIGTFWGMLPNIACLFGFVALSYWTLKDKWLSLLGFGSFTLVSVIVMGQIDIFSVLFIYISMLLLLKASDDSRYLSLVFLSFLSLGISLEFKTYGGILLPVYGLYTFSLLKKRNVPELKAYTAVAALSMVFIAMYAIPWLPFSRWFGYTVSNSESSWIFNLQLSPIGLSSYHTISIWLIGFGLIIYAYFRDVHRPSNATASINSGARRFIFYCFAITAWFFITVYSQPQWWIFILPSILLVLDNFRNRLNYVLCLALMGLYLFYPMLFTGWPMNTLGHYIPVFPFIGTNATILMGLLILVLGIWTMELWEELKYFENHDAEAHDNGISPVLRPVASLVTCLAPFFVVTLVVSLVLIAVGVAGPNNLQADQPTKFIYANNVVGQTFRSPNDGLYEIDIWFDPNTSLNAGDVIFHLKENSSSDDLRSMKINGSNLAASSPLKIIFPPIADSKGKEYVFSFESPGSGIQDKVALSCDTMDVYADGSAYYDDEPTSGDLEFKTHYKFNPLSF